MPSFESCSEVDCSCMLKQTGEYDDGKDVCGQTTHIVQVEQWLHIRAEGLAHVSTPVCHCEKNLDREVCSFFDFYMFVSIPFAHIAFGQYDYEIVLSVMSNMFSCPNMFWALANEATEDCFFLKLRQNS